MDYKLAEQIKRFGGSALIVGGDFVSVGSSMKNWYDLFASL